MPQTEAWTIGRLLTWTTDYLKKTGSDSPRLDAEILLAEACGCERIQLYTAFGDEPSEQARVAFRELVRRRAEHTPVRLIGVDRHRAGRDDAPQVGQPGQPGDRDDPAATGSGRASRCDHRGVRHAAQIVLDQDDGLATTQRSRRIVIGDMRRPAPRSQSRRERLRQRVTPVKNGNRP